MSGLDEQKALEIMELSPDATKDEISKRYGVLTRKFRNLDVDEKGYTMEDVTRAYHLLMGITFTDRKEEERQRNLRENPPLLARLLKMDPVKLENFFHYYKIHILVSVAVILFLIFFIRSCINRIPTDFSLVFYGNLYAEDQTLLESDIKERLPELAAPGVQFLSGNESDPQYQYAMQMKLMAMLSAKEIDIMIMDEASFVKMASQGVLLALDEKKDILGFEEKSYMKASEVIEQSEDGKIVLGPEKIYGVDITGSAFVRKNNIIGEKMIAAIVVNTDRMDKAAAFMLQLKQTAE